MTLRSLLLLLLFAAPPAHAQMAIHQVDLREQKLVLDKPTFHVTEVVDLRAQHLGIGWVQVGMGNIRVPANLAGGVREGLGGWLQVQLPPRPSSRPVIMRVHELRIDEQTKATSEKATADVDVDFVQQQADGSYYVVQRFIEHEESKGLETTARHDDHIVACVQRACAQLNALDWSQRLKTATVLTEEQMRNRGGRKPAPYTYAILAATPPPKGIYRTFLDFRNNKPVAAPALVVEKKPRTAAGWQGTYEVEAYTPVGTAREPLRDVWGFSDGEQAYILRQRHFYPLQLAGQDFTFDARAVADPGAVSTAAVLGGAAGAVIASVSTSGERQQYTLDMATGRVSDFAYLDHLAQHDTATVVVYRRPGGLKAPVSVQLDGRELAALPPNDFVSIPWTSKTREISLCLPGGEAACLSFIPVFGLNTYVDLEAKTEAAKPVLSVVPGKEGEFYVKKMRRKP
ncbi:hypothetical protein SAMN02745146_2135 [Hymenobacter daecheongensis DSM 21074]|uniref:DUF4139 domain-containing protein n=1 Tax=Hymenobacter daecheongensis DSM 21074 TaxID=1121955 RepID=A0A1M6G6Q0_9BACT|nr:hypothetical protein [Hymenobacter daecheongensis]SHJ05467.1 hypothetical protein SAMN02745146_2135 [Hymenobacter daecheongensis DSM 21074]